jgi:hypothetical protein
MQIPIACSLDGASARAQVEEWRALLAPLVVASERPDPQVLRLRLRAAGPARLAELVGLAQREKACCPFFAFSLEIEPDAVTFVSTVPPEAAGVLDRFAGLAGPRNLTQPT